MKGATSAIEESQSGTLSENTLLLEEYSQTKRFENMFFRVNFPLPCSLKIDCFYINIIIVIKSKDMHLNNNGNHLEA